jgi:UDP-2-acetamido-3-amino-2,3-dideoxy-glucuronate N-acetyltransferase
MIRIHPTADVSPKAIIGEGTAIWHQCQVREGVHLGQECILGKNVYVDFDVQIGNRVKIQNNCSVYHGATIEDGVFLGPHVVLTNDLYPRAINPDGTLKGADDWDISPIRIGYGAAVGARSVVLPGVTIGRFAMIGAGSVVTRDVPAHGLVVGAPARLIGYVCACGHRLRAATDGGLACATCGRGYTDPPAA